MCIRDSLALADGAGEHRAAAKGGGEGLGGFTLGRKAAEDSVLAVVTYKDVYKRQPQYT